MAQVPSEQEVNNAILHTEQEIQRKREEQELAGKEFAYSEDGFGPGVIPEDIWKGLKQYG